MHERNCSNKKGVTSNTGTGKTELASGLPKWFIDEKSLPDNIRADPSALSHYLTSCRQDIYSALSLYQVHLRYASTLLTSLLTLMVGIMSIIKWVEPKSEVIPTIKFAGGFLMLVGFITGVILLYVVTRYHNFFVATLLHATQVHFAAGLTTFSWFQSTIELLGKYNQDAEGKTTKERFIHWRSWHRSHSHFWYFLLLVVLTALSLSACIYLWDCCYLRVVAFVFLAVALAFLVRWIGWPKFEKPKPNLC